MSDSDEESMNAASNVHASGASAESLPEQSSHSKSSNNQLPFNIMLTCYTLFERDSVDQQADRSFLRKWSWSHLLLDEAHAVKNASAMRTKRLTRFAGQT